MSYKNIIILQAIMIYQHHYTNNFLDFSRGQHLHPIYRVMLSLFFGGGIGTPFHPLS